MIIGIGTDLVAVARIAAVHQRQQHRFLARVYTAEEQQYCLAARDPAERLAARWAAKEACMKALGTGHSRGVLWKDIEVFRDYGPPQLRLHGGAARRADSMQVKKSLLTITHSESLAMAQVLLFGPSDNGR